MNARLEDQWYRLGLAGVLPLVEKHPVFGKLQGMTGDFALNKIQIGMYNKYSIKR